MSFFEPANTQYPYFFVALNTAHTTGVSGAETAIPFDTIAFNNGNGWNNTTKVFTAPDNGLYYFTISIAVANSGAAGVLDGVYFGLKAVLGGVTRYYRVIEWWAFSTTGSSEVSTSFGVAIPMVTGDTVVAHYADIASRSLFILGSVFVTPDTYYRSSFSGCLVCAT